MVAARRWHRLVHASWRVLGPKRTVTADALSSTAGGRLPPVGMDSKTDQPFVQELPGLLQERGYSLRRLAREAGVDPSHLSRVIRRVSYKTPSPELTRKVAEALGLPKDYFPEYRQAVVVERIRRDSRLRERLYAELK
jgi:lambda repressor-like predicted transcriptional regulator